MITYFFLFDLDTIIYAVYGYRLTSIFESDICLIYILIINDALSQQEVRGSVRKVEQAEAQSQGAGVRAVLRSRRRESCQVVEVGARAGEQDEGFVGRENRAGDSVWCISNSVVR